MQLTAPGMELVGILQTARQQFNSPHSANENINIQCHNC